MSGPRRRSPKSATSVAAYRDRYKITSDLPLAGGAADDAQPNVLIENRRPLLDHVLLEKMHEEIELGLRESHGDVRELLVHFRTRASEDDIEEALRSTLSKFEHQTGIATELELSGHGLPLAPDVQIQVLHIVQEALSNVRKHAQARQVQVRVQRHPWSVEVQDDGVGFDTSVQRSADSPHVGLGIMRERASGIGASVAVQSQPGLGTTMRITLPEPHTLNTPTLA